MYQVQKWGNSLGIRIPKSLAIKVGLEEGTEFDFEVEDDRLVIKPKSKTLDELLSRITPDNIHSEISTDKPRGRETW